MMIIVSVGTSYAKGRYGSFRGVGGHVNYMVYLYLSISFSSVLTLVTVKVT